MKEISLCLIVRNEEDNIKRCLDSFKGIYDELIIVDTGSVDKTKEICSLYTSNIFDFNWINDFSKARNYGISKASKEYIMWVDADDYITEINRDKIINLKKNISCDVAMIKYNNYYDLDDKPVLTYYRERIFKNNKNYYFNDPIHEYVNLVGNIEYFDISIEHYKTKSNDPLRNVKIYKELENTDHIFTPRQLYYYARELYDTEDYKKSIKYLRDFLKTKKGFIEDEIGASLLLYKCYKNLKKEDIGVTYLFDSFRYDVRAEVLFEIGNYFYNKKKYKNAIFFYMLIFNMKKEDNKGFVLVDVYNYSPLIMISLCYYELNEIKKAIYYNSIAKLYKPEDKTVLNNEEFFNSLLN